MKKLLLSLVAVLATVGAWAQPQTSDAPADGQWAANTTWYRVETGNNYSLQIDKVTSEGYLALTSTTDSNSDIALWCVVGNQEGGYKFYNKAKGTTVVLGMTGTDGGASAVFVEDGADGYTTAFDFVRSEKSGAEYWCIKAHGTPNNYWNRLNSGDNRLKYWNSTSATGGDNGSAFLFTEVDLATLEYASSDDITTAKNLISVAPGYPKTTTSQYITLNELTQCSGVVNSELTSAVNAYKTCGDILLPEDGKAYTFTALFKDGKSYNMNYTNGSKLSVSDEVTASTFVCKELREGVYAFITEDGKILTWVGNDEGNAYKETDFSAPYGYSNYYATTYNNKSDWNEITVKKNDSNAEQLGLLRLVARRHSTGTSSFIANTDKRFDQASDGNWFNSDNTSGWIVTEVEHTNTEQQNVALAKIDVKETGYSFGTKVGEYYYMDGEEKISDNATVYAALDGKTSVDDVNAFESSFTLNTPEAGKFYRLKNNESSWYASSDLRTGETNHKNKLYMKEDGTTASTIWYLTADNKLLSFTKGQYLGDMSSDWAFETVGSEGNVVSFNESAIVGKYQILPSSGRALYGDNVRVDAAPSSNNSGNYAWIIEEVTTLPVTITSAGYATFYCPVAVSLPAEGLKAYYVSETTGSYAKMEEITGVIPANTGVILEGEADTYDLTIGGEAESVTNKLRGTVASEYITDDAYVLSMPTINDEVQPIGFYKATKNQSGNTAFLNNGFKAYLPASAVPAGARFLSFDFGTETALESSEGENGNVKAEIYDLAGRRVQNAQKGLYIVNGKKVIK